jgi:hypothetical protein
MPPVKYWEIIGDKLSAAGWAWLLATTRSFALIGEKYSIQQIAKCMPVPNLCKSRSWLTTI